jgi:phosphatidyl-myo-inositol dimannoside synthase
MNKNEKMKKLLIITKNLRSDSGVGRYSREVVRALADSGCRIKVLVERNVTEEVSYGGVEVKPVLFVSKTVLAAAANLFLARWHARSCSVVHALDGWPYGLYGYGSVLGTSKSLFISALGTYAVAPLQDPIKKILLSCAYRRAGKIFCISSYTQKRLLEVLPLTNTQVVHLAVSRLPELSAKDIQQMTDQYPIAQRKPIFLTVGQIKERKGQLDTLKSLELLKLKYPDFLYVMIGWDERKDYIESIHAYAKELGLERNILIITDSLDDTVPAFFYERCDVFLLNANNEKNHFEGFGLVILEAAQYAKPAIGSRGCGIEDAIRDGYSGYITGQKEHKEIADRVEEVLKNYLVFSRNAAEFATRFTWENTARTYSEAYETAPNI